jgi:type II secretory pathway pseudopilin PulG
MKLKINNKKIRKERLLTGFTLIEALVAISILMIAIASPITIAQKSLSSSMFSRDQMIANFLIQDAIEGIKNIRDQIAMNNIGTAPDLWLNELVPCICNNGTNNCNLNDNEEIVTDSCDIDTTKISYGSTDYINPFVGNILPIKAVYSSEDGIFKKFSSFDTGGTPTKFKRVIKIEKNPNGDNVNEAKVKVRVFWDSPLGEKKIDVIFYMYNYEPKFRS